MDSAKFDQLKQALLDQIDRWDGSDRGFSDIVKNAIDLDYRVAPQLKSVRNEDYKTIKGWGAGRNLPDDQGEVIAVIRGYFQSK